MSDDAKIARKLADAAASIAAASDREMTAQRVCELAVDLIPACDHASVTVRHRKSFETLAATSDMARELDATQYELDQGPCVDAAENDEALVSPRLADDPRWPQWAPRAAQMGARSLMSVPLMQELTKVGAMNFYSNRAEPWGDQDEEMACLYAIHASALLAAAHEIDGLKTALGTRHRIGMAQGVLMKQYRLTPEAAFAVLHRTSNDENRRIIEVVDGILENTIPG